MRKYIVIMVTMLSMTAWAQPLFVGTYNIRNHNSYDESRGDVWQTRCKVICDLINFEDPDIFGTQEALYGQITDFDAALDGYDHIGVARDDGKQAGEYSAIFYKKERLTLINSGNFWLSETPDKPSLGWDAACIRICSWGEFEQKDTQLHFFFFNLHMDHIGIIARREGAKLTVKRIKEIAGDAPVVLTGDFNVDQTDEIYTIFTESGILKDSYECAEHRLAENGTFNSFDSELQTESRIDHVFVSEDFSVNRYGILTDCYWTELPESEMEKGDDAPRELNLKKQVRRTPSDHYPVLVKLSYND